MNDLLQGGGATRYRVLLVDDDPWMLRIMKVSLSPIAAVVTCASGEQALRALEIEEFDVVCSDLRMPGMSGDELLRAVAAAHAMAGLLLVTGLADAAEIELDAGYEVLTKPFDPEHFAAVVDRLASGARSRSSDDIGAAGRASAPYASSPGLDIRTAPRPSPSILGHGGAR